MYIVSLIERSIKIRIETIQLILLKMDMFALIERSIKIRIETDSKTNTRTITKIL